MLTGATRLKKNRQRSGKLGTRVNRGKEPPGGDRHVVAGKGMSRHPEGRLLAAERCGVRSASRRTGRMNQRQGNKR